MNEAIRLEKDGPIGKVLFDKPENRNAMDAYFFQRLVSVITELEADPAIRVVILTSTHPKAFLAGADIAYMLHNAPAQAKRFCELGCAVFTRMRESPLPFIAAINGHCLGGGLELALACDLRIAVQGCKLGFPEVKLGILPGWGGLYRLPRLVGEGRARELLFTGRLLSTEEAERAGLVNYAVPPEGLMEACEQAALEIARNAPIPIALMKKWMPRAAAAADETADCIGGAAMVDCFATQDQEEGMRAFLEKRAPRFTGE